MSAAAEQVREDALRIQSEAAVKRCEDLVAMMETWWDAGLEPPDGLVVAYRASIAAAETIMLERALIGEASDSSGT